MYLFQFLNFHILRLNDCIHDTLVNNVSGSKAGTLFRIQLLATDLFNYVL